MNKKKSTASKKAVPIFLTILGIAFIAAMFQNQAGESLLETGFLFRDKTHEGVLAGTVICVDAGHGLYPEELKGPGNPEGTSGANQTEEQLNLKVAKRLEEKLLALGAEVYMTRTEAQSDMGNFQRAEFANRLDADLCIKIHADSNADPNINGITVLVPGSNACDDSAVLDNSRIAGEIILKELLDSTGANRIGISVRTDLTGFYWSEIPVVLVEMGFMSNPEEDLRMESDEYQNKLADGMANGIVRCLTKGI